MIINVKRDGCSYDFEVFIRKQFDNSVFYQVRHAGCTIIVNDSDDSDISSTAVKICIQVLNTIEVIK
jgi:ABC-type uncharacterized transport system YnjBCD ATPase subunit